MPRVLVTYGTRYGSTAEIAERIGACITAAGFDTDVLQANPYIDIRKYDALVVGSPMYGGKWLSEPSLLLYLNSEILNSTPLAVFTVGTLDVKHPGQLEKSHQEFFAEIFQEEQSLPEELKHATFDGVMDRTNLPWYLRIFDMLIRTSPTGDFRDWEKIDEWTDDVVRLFQSALQEEALNER